jgi:membrane protease YdiL (CAAX protease family)
VLAIGFIGEAILGCIALAWIVIADLPVVLTFNPLSAVWGVLFALPLLCIGLVILEMPAVGSRIPEYDFFKHEIVIPLCLSLTAHGALLIALMSGLCEELLFRGALDTFAAGYTGALVAGVISSVAFSLTHFIGVMWKFRALACLYTLAGGYLWIELQFTGDLMAPMITHAFYNFVVIRFIQYRYKSTDSSASPL